MSRILTELDFIIMQLTNKKLKDTAKRAENLKSRIQKNNKFTSQDQNELDQYKYIAAM